MHTNTYIYIFRDSERDRQRNRRDMTVIYDGFNNCIREKAEGLIVTGAR